MFGKSDQLPVDCQIPSKDSKQTDLQNFLQANI